jgi:molecular chaperone GrpE (heat shock protein)
VQQLSRHLQWSVTELLEIYQERDSEAEGDDEVKPSLESQADSELAKHCQKELENLRQAYLHLQTQSQHQEQQNYQIFQAQTFNCLHPLLTSYPSICQRIQQQPDLPARNLLPLFRSLDSLIQMWGYEVIGKAWAQVAFDPQIHQADNPDLQPGDPVYIRFVGYRYGDDILCPAKVSQTLPQ